MTHTAVILKTPGLVPPPEIAKDWTAQRARNGMQRLVMIQFYVPHMGFHEVWQFVGIRDGENGRPYYDGFGRCVVNMARDHYDKKWPGTSHEMVCTGAAVWNGTEFENVTHMKHIR